IISFKENLIALQELDQSVEIIIRLLCTVPGICKRVADIKTRAQAMKCLTTFSEAMGPCFVFKIMFKIMKEHNNPKVLSEGFLWMVSAVEDFGVTHLKLKDVINFCKRHWLTIKRFVDALEPSVKDELLKNFCDKELMKDCFWDPIRASRAGKNRDKICLGQMPIKYK
ncbi:protein MOR1, partial [Tanacetum coccineum]